jgi:hypothetical protein
MFGRHESFGKVPHYILKRKEEMLKAKQSDKDRLVDFPEDCPVGMRLLKANVDAHKCKKNQRYYDFSKILSELLCANR